jgi:hypothetical protein
MNWRKLNNILHRDIGYFFVAMTLIYAISGIAINHKHDWNPSYIINIDSTIVDLPRHHTEIYKEDILKVLAKYGIEKSYKSFIFEDTTRALVYFGDSNMEINIPTGNTRIEWVKRKPLFFEVNFLHYNPGVYWTIFSDIYAIGLIILAITGMFVLQGKKGLKGRGKWFVIAGFIIPMIFLFFYLN